MALGGVFEFLEAYFDGGIDIVGEHGLRKLVNLAYRKPFGRFEHLVLGDTYGYSEGLWLEDTRSLDEAQHNNFDRICQKLRLGPGVKLIEVGPGWGYLSMLAAQKYGADVTAYGLVGSRNDAMRGLMQSRNFRGKLTLVEKDHRELADEPAVYDRFVSVGVHEHAGRDCNEQWIRSIALGLGSGGVGLISATFNMRKRPTNYCTIRHIFPGGYIPSLAETLLLLEKYGLDVRAIENVWYHYHRSVD